MIQQNFASNPKTSTSRVTSFVLGYEYKPNRTGELNQDISHLQCARGKDDPLQCWMHRGRFYLPQISHWSMGTDRNYRVELTVEKILRNQINTMPCSPLPKVNTKGSDAHQKTHQWIVISTSILARNGTKWILTTDIEIPLLREEDTFTPHRSGFRRLARQKKCCNRIGLYQKLSLPQDGSQNWGRTSHGAGPSIFMGLLKSYQSAKRLLGKRYNARCQVAWYSIPNWIFPWHFMEGSVLVQVECVRAWWKKVQFI